MSYKSRNFAKTTLATAITTESDSITVATGTGSRFPTLAPGEFTMVVLQDAAGKEVVKATAVAGDVLTVERAQEGSTARAFDVGAIVDCRLTSGVLSYIMQLVADVSATVSSLTSSLAGKQAAITGAATSITSSNLSIGRALVSDASGKVAVSSITTTQLSYLEGVSGNLQEQINGLAPAAAVTAERALVSDASGAVAASTVTAAELARLAGVTSPVQTQLDTLEGSLAGKAATSHTHNYVSTNVGVGVGAICFLGPSVTGSSVSYSPGSISSALRWQYPPSGVGAPSGTWKCLGYCSTNGDTSRTYCNWQRIS